MTSCLRLVPDRHAAWVLLMNLAGQNWAGMELAHSLADARLGTVTRWRPVPTDATIEPGRVAGTFENIAMRIMLVDAEANELHVVMETVAGSDGAPLEGCLLPVSAERFVLRVSALGDDLPVTFLEPDDGGRYA